MIHAPSGCVWNRHGEWSTLAPELTKPIRLMRDAGVVWAHCEVLGRRHEIAKGSIVILDTILEGRPEATWMERRTHMVCELNLPTQPLEPEEFEEKTIYLVATRMFDGKNDLMEFWDQIKSLAGDVKPENQFYEGLVAWRTDRPYPIQTRSPGEECPAVMKHRWRY
jgi:hypothetical protein